MNHISDTTDIGITFQMTLDAFLDETHPVKDTNQNTYRDALKKLEEANHCLSLIHISSLKWSTVEASTRLRRSCLSASQV